MTNNPVINNQLFRQELQDQLRNLFKIKKEEDSDQFKTIPILIQIQIIKYLLHR